MKSLREIKEWCAKHPQAAEVAAQIAREDGKREGPLKAKPEFFRELYRRLLMIS